MSRFDPFRDFPPSPPEIDWQSRALAAETRAKAAEGELSALRLIFDGDVTAKALMDQEQLLMDAEANVTRLTEALEAEKADRVWWERS